jgi:E3 ubiquitin-protein ligase HUWE1
MIIALCSDIAPTLDIKDLAEDLVSVRKQVLDAVAKAIKESTSIVDLDSRYGRLYALGELTYRLLVSRPSITAKQDESGTHIAKTMIEKNFVGIITAAAGEVDLNYPEIRGTLGSLLKALEHLSKMSIKWSKAEKGKPTKADDEDTDTESEESEMDFSEEEETPNLYLNSSLGRYVPVSGCADVRLGGGVDEDMEDEDEEDEEDDMVRLAMRS